MEYAAPETRIPTAASKDQKYRSLPWPNGWRRSAGRRDRRSAVSSSTSVTESPTECADSDSSAAEPVTRPANALSTAMPTLAANASTTVTTLSDEPRSGWAEGTDVAAEDSGMGGEDRFGLVHRQ